MPSTNGSKQASLSAETSTSSMRFRRELVRMRRITAPTVEICTRLRTLEVPGLDAEIRPYFSDLYAHARTINESVDALREVLDFGFEAIHLQESSRQGDMSRRFAGWAAILAVPTAIAGIYGMNFEYMPELTWRYGYFLGRRADPAV